MYVYVDCICARYVLYCMCKLGNWEGFHQFEMVKAGFFQFDRNYHGTLTITQNGIVCWIAD